MKVEFQSGLFVEELDDVNWRLIAPLKAAVTSDDNFLRIVEVPAGFETDFASVPRLPIVYEKFGNKAHKPAVLHDYLYSIGGDEVDRKFADQVFLAAMIADGMDSTTAHGMYDAVRAFGAPHFLGKEE